MSVEAVRVRLDDHHRRLTELEQTKPAVIANDVEALRRDIAELAEEVRALRRVGWSIAGSLLVVAVTAYQIAGG